jgi:hypothetical protein
LKKAASLYPLRRSSAVSLLHLSQAAARSVKPDIYLQLSFWNNSLPSSLPCLVDIHLA